MLAKIKLTFGSKFLEIASSMCSKEHHQRRMTNPSHLNYPEFILWKLKTNCFPTKHLNKIILQRMIIILRWIKTKGQGTMVITSVWRRNQLIRLVKESVHWFWSHQMRINPLNHKVNSRVETKNRWHYSISKQK